MAKKAPFYPGFFENRFKQRTDKSRSYRCRSVSAAPSSPVARPVFFSEPCHPEEPYVACAPQGKLRDEGSRREAEIPRGACPEERQRRRARDDNYRRIRSINSNDRSAAP